MDNHPSTNIGDHPEIDRVADMNNLLKYAILTRMSYANKISDSDIASHPELSGITPVVFFDNDHAQCWIFESGAELIVSFRGTDSMEDAMRNVNFIPTEFNVDGMSCGRVHKGYLDYYTKLRPSVIPVLEAYVERQVGARIVFVGHSLGGCVVMCALEMAIRQPHVDTCVCTFGAPAMGNKKFRDMVQSRIRNVTRVVYDSDIVPRVPIHEHLAEPLFIKECSPVTDVLCPQPAPSTASESIKRFMTKCLDHHHMENYIDGIQRKLMRLDMSSLRNSRRHAMHKPPRYLA